MRITFSWNSCSSLMVPIIAPGRDFHCRILVFVKQLLASALIIATTSPKKAPLKWSLCLIMKVFYQRVRCDSIKHIAYTRSLLSWASNWRIIISFLLWIQQVQDVIMSQKLHWLLGNSVIPPQYAMNEDRLSAKYDQWLVEDQMMFTWLLSMISNSALPRVLSCEHPHQGHDILECWYRYDNTFVHQLQSHKAPITILLRNLKTTLMQQPP